MQRNRPTVRVCQETARVFPDSTVLTSQIGFRHETLFRKILPIEMASAIPRRLK